MNYTLNLDTPDFEIRVDPAAHYGYWEFRPMNNVVSKIYFGPAAPAAGEVLHCDPIPETVAHTLRIAEYVVDAVFVVPDPTEPPKERRRV